MSDNEPTREQLLAALAAARADFEASEQHLAAIVRAWRALDPSDRSAIGLEQLSREIRDAQASRAGEWWR
jgi:hypothetical protein